MKFIKKESAGTDIFCFQEVLRTAAGITESHGARANIYNDLAAALPDFNGYFAEEQDGFDLEEMVDFNISYGKVIFIRKSAEVDSSGAIFVYGEKNSGKNGDIQTLPASFQYVRIKMDGKNFTICNLHGVFHPGHKLDTPERIAQSKKIIEFLKNENCAKILCGDFNLMPETESLKMIERENMINLIKTYNISQTRSSLSPFFGQSGFQKFADYVLVSPDVNVINFSVPDVAVSDHLPLVLEFS